MADILIVDDEVAICSAFSRFLQAGGHKTQVASSGEEALRLVETKMPDLVILDIRLPGLSGLEVLQRIKQQHEALPVVIVTAHGTMGNAIEAMQRGAFEYLVKPVDLARAREVVAQALASRMKSGEVEEHRTAAERPLLVGTSAPMQEVYKKIATAGMNDLSVLVEGESGTGKEQVALAIHVNSPRRSGQFVPINCGSLPDTLLESELFGHEEGAFTGAVRRKAGRVESADGGTLFLDEVAELSTAAQVKLLRFLETHRSTRLGSTEQIPVDVRVIAATNQPVERLIEEGRFRRDLYYRLNVLPIRLVPLRERLEDLPQLVAHFLDQVQASLPTAISPEALDALRRYPWPGNVRELRNAIEHAGVAARGRIIGIEHLPEHVSAPQLRQGPAGSRASSRHSCARNSQQPRRTARQLTMQFSPSLRSRCCARSYASPTAIRHSRHACYPSTAPHSARSSSSWATISITQRSLSAAKRGPSVGLGYCWGQCLRHFYMEMKMDDAGETPAIPGAGYGQGRPM